MSRLKHDANSPLHLTEPSTEPWLDLSDIQGDVLAGFNKPHQALIGIRIPANGRFAAKQFLRRLLPAIELSSAKRTHAAKLLVREKKQEVKVADLSGSWKPRLRKQLVNVAFSHDGLCLLTDQVYGFSQAFVDGQWRRAAKLGDPYQRGKKGSLGTWVVGGSRATTPHLLIICAADEKAGRDDLRRSLLRRVRAAGLKVMWWQDGDDLPRRDGVTGREHFGFKDGIAHPGIRGVEESGTYYVERKPDTPQDATLPEFASPGVPLVWPGQLLLGHARQSATDTRACLGAETQLPPWTKNGSYLVFRRLRQDVPAFRRFVAEAAEKCSQQAPSGQVTPQRLAALLVGRWQNGSPLERSPRKQGSVGKQTLNDFEYMRAGWPRNEEIAPDVLGERCPISAHIRKVNPRDQGTDLGPAADSLRRTLIRRGIPYGPELPPNRTDRKDRGLLFLSFQASIEETFEAIMQSWVNADTGPTTPGGFDMLLGRDAGGGPRYCDLLGTRLETAEPFVYATGGGYFFAPSISAIRDVLAG